MTHSPVVRGPESASADSGPWPVRLTDVTVRYPNGTVGLRGVSLSVEPGEMVAVVGLSGSGKSTMIRTVNGLVPATSGTVEVGPYTVNELRGRRLRRQAVLENAKAAGLNPGTVIDVGFAIGTEGLFGVFEDAENFLIEPIAEMEPAMQAFCAQNPRSRYLLAAASDENGVKSMVARRAVGASGFHSNPKVGDAEITRAYEAVADLIEWLAPGSAQGM